MAEIHFVQEGILRLPGIVPPALFPQAQALVNAVIHFVCTSLPTRQAYLAVMQAYHAHTTFTGVPPPAPTQHDVDEYFINTPITFRFHRSHQSCPLGLTRRLPDPPAGHQCNPISLPESVLHDLEGMPGHSINISHIRLFHLLTQTILHELSHALAIQLFPSQSPSAGVWTHVPDDATGELGYLLEDRLMGGCFEMEWKTIYKWCFDRIHHIIWSSPAVAGHGRTEVVLDNLFHDNWARAVQDVLLNPTLNSVLPTLNSQLQLQSAQLVPAPPLDSNVSVRVRASAIDQDMFSSPRPLADPPVPYHPPEYRPEEEADDDAIVPDRMGRMLAGCKDWKDVVYE